MRMTNTARTTGFPPIVCIEDREHTARCVMAIRERKRREAEARIVEEGRA
jgi:hypothetical protein